MEMWKRENMEICKYPMPGVGFASRRNRRERGGRVSWRSIRPNFCAGSKSNGRLAPIFAREANRTVVWPQFLRGKQIEQSFGSKFCAGSKSNGRLAPNSAREANRTVVWLQILRGEQIEQLFGSADGRRGKSNSLLATTTVKGVNNGY